MSFRGVSREIFNEQPDEQAASSDTGDAPAAGDDKTADADAAASTDDDKKDEGS